jgi:hypothetical protein
MSFKKLLETLRNRTRVSVQKNTSSQPGNLELDFFSGDELSNKNDSDSYDLNTSLSGESSMKPSSFSNQDEEFAVFTLSDGDDFPHVQKNSDLNFIESNHHKRNFYDKVNDDKRAITKPVAEDAKWILPGERITVKGKQIVRGFFYYGKKLNAHNSGFYDSMHGSVAEESSLVNESMLIKNEHYLYEDTTHSYFSKFIQFSPQSRGAYIDWLASDRNDPDTPIAYVWVYFYGFERRILIDYQFKKIIDHEFSLIFCELLRLKDIYKNNKSFFTQCSKLIEIMTFIRPDLVSIKETDYLDEGSNHYRFKLSNLVANEKPIPSDLALIWAKKRYPRNFTGKKWSTDCEMDILFDMKFNEKFNKGLFIKPNKTKLELEYKPASSSIKFFQIVIKSLPDPSILTGPLNKITQMAISCSSSLFDYRAYIGKPNTTKLDINGILLLPNELYNAMLPSLSDSFCTYVDSCISEKNGLFDLSEFLNKYGFKIKSKNRVDEINIIERLAVKSGYYFPLSKNILSIKGSDNLFIMAKNNRNTNNITVPGFNGVMIAIGIIALFLKNETDNSLSDKLSLLVTYLEENNGFSKNEKNIYLAYVTWLSYINAPLSFLKKEASTLSDEEKSAAKSLILPFFLKENKVDVVIIKRIEKIYSILAIEKDQVIEDIHLLSSNGFKGDNYFITKSRVSNENGDTKFFLDEKIIKHHEDETKVVRNILDDIFSEQTELKTETEVIIKNEGNQKVSLDTKHFELFKILSEQPEWDRKDVEIICQELGVLVDGALETINDWSFELIDEAVIDISDSIFIDLDFVEDIRGKNNG